MPSTTLVPSAGPVISTVGGSFGAAVIVTVIPAETVTLPLFVTDAVTVCVPTESVALTLAPVPSAPPGFEVHTRFALKSPSSVSFAVPSKVSSVPSTTLVPSAGPVIVTVGGGSSV